MLKLPKTSADQWVALAAVVDNGGYAGAAEALDRSQSAVSYQVSQLQRALGCRLLELQGRRAVLSTQGEVLLARARDLLEQWHALENYAHSLARGFEATLKLVVDVAFPRARLLAALELFQTRCPQTRLDLSEAVLSGAEEAIVDGAAYASADVVVTSRVPSGFLGDWLYETVFLACASPSHPLHALGRSLTAHDLEQQQQVVLRDSGERAPRDEGFLGAQTRWTVGSLEASVAIVEAGLAFAWLPEHAIAASLAAQRLQVLPLQAGASRNVPLYIVLVQPARAGPAAQAMLELLHRHALDGADAASS